MAATSRSSASVAAMAATGDTVRPHWRYRAAHRWHYDIVPYLRWRWSVGRLRWAWLALQQRAVPEGDWMLSRAARWRLTAKVLLSMLLDRPIVIPEGKHYVDTVTIATADGHHYFSMDCIGAYEWNELVVAYEGLGWRVRSEGNC